VTSRPISIVGALCLVRRLDAGKADFAAIIEAKAARIDHGTNAAFALRFERATRSERCMVCEHDTADCDHHAACVGKLVCCCEWPHGSMLA
jgi:hypothetical protein